MKLLIVTQAVDINNPVLGFFHRWIEEFAKKFEFVTVICLEKGEYELPNNVKVLSLGKEEGKSRIKYLYRFYKYIWQERKNYDAVFVHMNPEYVCLGGMVWRFLSKKIGLWYTHKNVDFKLRIAEKLTDFIFTASKESMRLNSPKRIVTGHGIDTDFFNISSGKKNNSSIKKILTVGRITESKNILLMLQAILLVKENIVFTIVGAPHTSADYSYIKELEKFIDINELKDKVFFIGPKKSSDIKKYLEDTDIFLNASNTGSLDKAVLEAMSMNVDIIVSNQAFSDIIPSQYVSCDMFSFASKISEVCSQKTTIRKYRDIIICYHNIGVLIEKLSKLYNGTNE